MSEYLTNCVAIINFNAKPINGLEILREAGMITSKEYVDVGVYVFGFAPLGTNEAYQANPVGPPGVLVGITGLSDSAFTMRVTDREGYPCDSDGLSVAMFRIGQATE